MESVFLFFILVVFTGVTGALIFKYRYDLRKWLKDPKYGSSWAPGREIYLKRRIEDSEAELKWLSEPPKKD